jgi:hypothetical protein
LIDEPLAISPKAMPRLKEFGLIISSVLISSEIAKFFELALNDEVVQHHQVLANFLSRNQLVIETYPPVSYFLYKIPDHIPFLYVTCNILITVGTCLSLLLIVTSATHFQFLSLAIILCSCLLVQLHGLNVGHVSPITVADSFSELACFSALALSITTTPPTQPSWRGTQNVCLQGVLLAAAVVSSRHFVATVAAWTTLVAVAFWDNFRRLADHDVSLVYETA